MFKMSRIHLFRTEVADKPGGTAAKLKALAEAGAHLEYVYSERSSTSSGIGALYVAPRQTKAEEDLVKKVGLKAVEEPIVMRFEGDDKSGLGSRVTAAWETAGINLHGLMMAVLSGRFVGYATFDTVMDANSAATILAEIGAKE